MLPHLHGADEAGKMFMTDPSQQPTTTLLITHSSQGTILADYVEDGGGGA